MEKCGRAGQVTDDSMIRRMRYAFCIVKATDTQSEYVLLIAFPQHIRLHELATLLQHKDTACLGSLKVTSFLFKDSHVHFIFRPAQLLIDLAFPWPLTSYWGSSWLRYLCT